MVVERAVPPLEAGDRLGRAEFHRRYLATPRLRKAELVEGIVFVPSPLHLTAHAEPHAAAGLWLSTYALATPGVRVADNATVVLDAANEVQPDLLARIADPRHGRSRIGPDGFLHSPPELIVEIAASSVSYDVHAKRAAYERLGVAEYVVWRTLDGAIDWWRLQRGRYVAAPDAAGIVASVVLPGLVLDTERMLAGDLVGVVDALRAGLGQGDHAAFIRRLGASG
jgi:Uma2 family endonuclease